MKGLGVIFAGGSANIAFQLGAAFALQKAGMGRIRGIAGASFGVIAALLLATEAVTKGRAAWLSLLCPQVRNLPPAKLQTIYQILQTSGLHRLPFEDFRERFGKGVYDKADVEKFLASTIDFHALGTPLLQSLWLRATRFPEDVTVDFDLLHYAPEMRHILFLTVTSLPLLNPAMHFGNGAVYWDGGLSPLVPLRPLYEENGLRTFLIIHLTSQTRVHKEDYPDARIYELIPPATMNDRVGVLDFRPAILQARFEAGKKQAEDVLKVL